MNGCALTKSHIDHDLDMLTPGNPMDIGCVSAVSVRGARDTAPVRVDEIKLIAGFGIEGDIHSDPLSLRQLLIADAAVYQDLDLPAHALRENLLVTFDTSKLDSGTVLRIGNGVMLWLTFQCEACGHLNDHVAGLSNVIKNRRGVLARVVKGGVIRSGDAVMNLGPLMTPWSDDWRLRVHRVLDAIPGNLVLEYKQLARLSGVPSSYCRVFPRVIRNLGAAYARKAVPKQGKLGKARWDGAELFKAECPVQPYSRNLAADNTTSLTKENSMDSVRSDKIKEQLLNSLRQSTPGNSQRVEIGNAKVLLTQSRIFKHDTTPAVEIEPYPEVACAVANEYDSWLR